jgi:mycofactocin precursor
MVGRQEAAPVRKKGLGEMTGEHTERDDENIGDVDELLVEEVSVDGMCGVY